MAVDIRFLGQACFELTSGGTTVLTDPFLTGNPKAAASADEVSPDVILLTHGHADHLGDTVDVAKRTGATVVAIVELANEIGGAGVENVKDPNLGGTVTFDWGWVKLVPAWHTAVSPSGTPHTPAGLLIHVGDRLVYHLGDTCLFSDMQLIARRGDKVDLAPVPIGGHHTVDPLPHAGPGLLTPLGNGAFSSNLQLTPRRGKRAALAFVPTGAHSTRARFAAVPGGESTTPPGVPPCHYDTFPPIEADAQAFKE